MDSKVVIIPTYNEKENIEAIIRKVFSLEGEYHILVIDDGSPDGTAAIVKKLREEYGNDERINNLLCIYYKKLHNLSILKTREQWEREGFKVMNTVENRFPAWGKPVSRVNKETGESYTFYPVTHFYVPEAVCQA